MARSSGVPQSRCRALPCTNDWGLIGCPWGRVDYSEYGQRTAAVLALTSRDLKITSLSGYNSKVSAYQPAP
ncbi:protein of unknown function [Paraburkholderia kururiensis]